MKRLILTLAAGLLATGASAQDRPTLTVYTYDSFVADWGPGPAVTAAFEATCGCNLNLVAVGDGAAILSRLRLEGGNSDADIVLGIDTNLTAAAVETGLIAPHGISADLDLPVTWDDPHFLPYDYGYFAFVYDTTRVDTPPASFDALVESGVSLVIQDPRTSTPGLGLLLWVDQVLGDRAGAFWADLAPQIVTVTKGWDEAYGMFLEGEADMVLSYTTSPAYHRIAEADETKAAAIFKEGHYMQVEVAGVLAGTDAPDLAQAFLRFMVSDAFQSLIPTTNWMYPAKLPADGLPAGFDAPLADGRLLDAADAVAARDRALAVWLDALSR